MDGRTDATFSKLRRGGKFRGVTWSPWAPQYTRQDGTVIPAWGGVRKVHGRGLVKGRKRPSGTRVTKQSRLMEDTGNLRSQTHTNWRITKRLMRGRVRAPLAKKLQKQRPYFFFEVGKDTKFIRDTIGNHINGRRKKLQTRTGGLLDTLRSL